MPDAFKAEQYRHHADECRREAGRCSTPVEKNEWLVLREQWLRMAQDIDMRLNKSNARRNV
jgi:predicted transglutaminase-like cysteine proteinase